MRRLADRSTRGRTRPGRLRHLDAWVVRQLRVRSGLAVDVGVGWAPFTTVELADALPGCRVVGTEIDPERVAEAQARAPGLDVRLGGFDLPLAPGERPVLVRAMNVLRQYHPAAAADALDRLASSIQVGGWLIDGRSDRTGDRLMARVHVRTAAGRVPVALVCHTGFAAGFAPKMFQHLLPKDLGGPHWPVPAIARRFEAWEDAVTAARASGVRDPREAFVAAAARMRGVVHEPSRWKLGYLTIWL